MEVRIRTTASIRRDRKKRNYLKPSEYVAEVSKGGTLSINTKYGKYEVLPGQFEFIDAPSELLDLWRYTVRLIAAQADYRHSNTYAAACTLQSVQGKYDAARLRFENKYFNEEVKK